MMNQSMANKLINRNNHKLAYSKIGGVLVGFLLFSESVLAEDFRDQQDRMREEYYQEQERQLEKK